MTTESSDSIYRGRIGESEKPVKTFVVQLAEKVSREYEVIGANSMAEAIRLVKEYGGHFYNEYIDEHQPAQESRELEGSWDYHHDFAPKAMESRVSSPCVMNGKWFEVTRRRHGWHGQFTDSYLCDTIVKGGMGQLCSKCQQKLAEGYTLRQPKEDE